MALAPHRHDHLPMLQNKNSAPRNSRNLSEDELIAHQFQYVTVAWEMLDDFLEAVSLFICCHDFDDGGIPPRAGFLTLSRTRGISPSKDQEASASSNSIVTVAEQGVHAPRIF